MNIYSDKQISGTVLGTGGKWRWKKFSCLLVWLWPCERQQFPIPELKEYVVRSSETVLTFGNPFDHLEEPRTLVSRCLHEWLWNTAVDKGRRERDRAWKPCLYHLGFIKLSNENDREHWGTFFCLLKSCVLYISILVEYLKWRKRCSFSNS